MGYRQKAYMAKCPQYYLEDSTVEGKQIPSTGRTWLREDGVEDVPERIADTLYDHEEQEVFTVLDLGCGGAGYHPMLEEAVGERLAEYGHSGAVNMVGLDYHGEMLQAVKEQEFDYGFGYGEHPPVGFDEIEEELGMQAEAADGLTLVQGDAFTLPLQDSSVDATISQYMAQHHTQQVLSLFNEALRVTRDDGYVAFLDGYQWAGELRGPDK